MKQRFSWVLVGFGLVAVLGVGSASPAASTTKEQLAPPSVPGELIVRYRAGVGEAGRDAALATVAASERREFGALGAELVSVDAADTAQALVRLNDDPRVAYAEPNYLLKADGIPNDASFGQLWGLHNTGQTVDGRAGTPDADIDAVEAWDVAGGSSSTVVAVIDTGIDFAHPDLGGSAMASPRMWTNAGESCTGCRTDGIDNDANGYVDDWRGWDFANRDGDPADDHGHGTHIAGTIGAVGRRRRRRGGDQPHGRQADGAQVPGCRGFRHHRRRHRGHPLRSLQGRARRQRVLGWRGVLPGDRRRARRGGPRRRPVRRSRRQRRARQRLAAALPVLLRRAQRGRRRSDRTRATRSPISPTSGRESVDLAAPGDRIYSTLPGGAYDWWSGTSMATPHVAGAAALLRSVFPSATDLATKALLLRAVDERSSLSWIATRGRLNLDRAVRCAGAGKTWIESPRPGFTVSVGEAVRSARSARPALRRARSQ